MLVTFAAQPKDAITLVRLIVSKNYWCRSCGGGGKMEAANWIVTVALLCHTVLPPHWLPSRPLITRMNGINLTIQGGGNGTFKHSSIWVRSGLRGDKSWPMKKMQLTRWSVQSCTIFPMKKLVSLFWTSYLRLKSSFSVSLAKNSQDTLKSEYQPTQAKDDTTVYSIVPVHRASMHVERYNTRCKSCFQASAALLNKIKTLRSGKGLKAMLSTWFHWGHNTSRGSLTLQMWDALLRTKKSAGGTLQTLDVFFFFKTWNLRYSFTKESLFTQQICLNFSYILYL